MVCFSEMITTGDDKLRKQAGTQVLDFVRFLSIMFLRYFRLLISYQPIQLTAAPLISRVFHIAASNSIISRVLRVRSLFLSIITECFSEFILEGCFSGFIF